MEGLLARSDRLRIAGFFRLMIRAHVFMREGARFELQDADLSQGSAFGSRPLESLVVFVYPSKVGAAVWYESVVVYAPEGRDEGFLASHSGAALRALRLRPAESSTLLRHRPRAWEADPSPSGFVAFAPPQLPGHTQIRIRVVWAFGRWGFGGLRGLGVWRFRGLEV